MRQAAEDRRENEAILNAKRRIALVAETYGDRHPDYATALNQLALLLIMQQEPEKAEPLLREALEIRRQALGESHPDYATNLSSLGGLLWARDEYDGAEPLLRLAVDIRRRTLGAAHPKTIVSINSLEQFYKQKAKYQSLRVLDDIAAGAHLGADAHPFSATPGETVPPPSPVVRLGSGYVPTRVSAARPEGPVVSPPPPSARPIIPVVIPSEVTGGRTEVPAAAASASELPEPLPESAVPPPIPAAPVAEPEPIVSIPGSTAPVEPAPVVSQALVAVPESAPVPAPEPLVWTVGVLASEFAELRDAFDFWSDRLVQEAQRMRAEGTPPAADLLKGWDSVQARFERMVSRSRQMADDLGISPTPGVEVSLDEFKPFLESLAEADARSRQNEAIRAEALARLGRLSRLTCPENLEFAPLTKCLQQVEALRREIVAARSLNLPEEARSLADDTHPLVALLQLVEADETIPDDRWATLYDGVTAAFGESLAVAAARAKLVVAAA